MKKLYLLLLVVSISIAAHAQYKDSVTFGFEQLPPYNIRNHNSDFDIVLNNDTGNIWQVGHPKKSIFNSPFEGNNAIITDTINNYPVNNLSYFDIVFYNMGKLYSGLSCEFSFKHKYNTTKGSDGGYILVSTDNRSSWEQLLNEQGQLGSWCYGCWQYRQVGGLYKSNDTLQNGQMAFSGNSNGWLQSIMHFGSGGVKNQPFDTLIMRFVFESDSVPESNEGWIIDYFSVDEFATSSITETNKSNFRIHPNPANNTITIETTSSQLIQQLIIKDLLGRELLKEISLAQNNTELDISSLPQGQYIVEIHTDKGLSTQRVIVK